MNLERRNDYIAATITRSKMALRGTPKAGDWLFIALEANKAMTRDKEPRPTPPDQVVPVQLLMEDLPQRDCVAIAKLREHWFRTGGPVGILP